MKKIKTLMAISCLCLPIAGIAQPPSEMAKPLPAHIVQKIQEVTSRISLSEEKKEQLGNYLLQQDRLANEELAKRSKDSQLGYYYELSRHNLSKVLSPLEVAGFLADDYSVNKLLPALKYREQLKLSDKQIQRLLVQNEKFERLASAVDKEVFVKNELLDILNLQQYQTLLGIVYHAQSLANASADWKKLKINKLVGPADSVTLFPAIYTYHLESKSKPEYTRIVNNWRKADSLRAGIELAKPGALLMLNIMEDNVFRKNQFSEMIKNREQLKLSAAQTDSLFLKYKQGELQRITYNMRYFETTYNIKPFEFEQLSRILTPEQTTAYLEIKNANLAKDNARRDWEKATAAGLTVGINEQQTIAELTAYHLRWLVASDQITINRNQRNAFIRRDIELNKPALLKELDVAAGSAASTARAKHALTW